MVFVMIKRILNNKAFRVVYFFIRGVVIALLAFYFFFAMVEKVTSEYDVLGYRIFTINEDSMKPVYNLYDVILVKTGSFGSLKKGEDITYCDNNLDSCSFVTTKRIVDISSSNLEKSYVVSGINNKKREDIKKEQIYGKVVGKVYVISEINHIVRNVYGFFFLVFCPLVLVIVLESIDKFVDDISLEKCFSKKKRKAKKNK